MDWDLDDEYVPQIPRTLQIIDFIYDRVIGILDQEFS